MQSKLLSGDDDLVLEIVVFLGTCASDETTAVFLCKSGLLQTIIELLKAKQEDDEMVLQVVYLFHLLCTHESTKSYVIKDTDAVAYLIDLMHDKNSQVQKVCDSTLDLIAQIDATWAERVQREKFEFHNAQWLEIIRGQGMGHTNEDDPNGYEGYYDDPDDDYFEQLVRDTDALGLEVVGDEGNLLLESSESNSIVSNGYSEDMSRPRRPISAFRRTEVQS